MSDRAYTVQEGDCVSSIADQLGHFWQTVWFHPANQALREQRGDPNILAPGDVVMVPPLRPRTERCATGAAHVFRRKGVPARLRLRILDGTRPRAGEPYKLVIDGAERTGRLDGDGGLDEPIMPGVMRAELTVGDGPSKAVYRLRLGQLDPVDLPRGVQARLRQVGLDCGLSGDLDDATRAALSEFQRREGLPVTGDADGTTRARLIARCGA